MGTSLVISIYIWRPVSSPLPATHRHIARPCSNTTDHHRQYISHSLQKILFRQQQISAASGTPQLEIEREGERERDIYIERERERERDIYIEREREREREEFREFLLHWAVIFIF